MKRILVIGASILFVAVLFAGCSMSIPEQSLQGKLGGQAWTLVEGEVEESSFDSTKFSFDLVGEEVADDFDFYSGDIIFGSVPKEVGSYKVGLLKDASVTFYVDGVNNISTKGVVEVQEVGTDTVTLGFNVKVDADNYIEGVADITYVTE